MRLRNKKPPLLPIALLASVGIMLAAPAQASSDDVFADRGKIVASRDIQFADRADGGIDVFNAANGELIESLEPNSHNFIRALMRGLVRQRVRESKGSELPFHLTAWSDGELILDDPATNRSVALTAFGPTNAGDFVEMLPLKRIPAEGNMP
jgi:putative photosynthetic complex assembly protein